MVGNDISDRSTLTTGDIAKLCGVNFRTVCRWIDKGYLEAFKLPGRGDRRVTVDDFLHFLKRNKIAIPREYQDRNVAKVLVVDDDLNIVRVVERILKQAGFQIATARDGFEAGDLLWNFKPDVLVLDLNMPKMNGLEVIKHIRKTEKLSYIRILIISAMPKEQLEEAIRAGANDILEKPFKMEELIGKVSALSSLVMMGGVSNG